MRSTTTPQDPISPDLSSDLAQPHPASEEAQEDKKGRKGLKIVNPADPDAIPPPQPPEPPKNCYANVIRALTTLPAWSGVLGYDEFRQKVMLLKRPPSDPGGNGEGENANPTPTWRPREWRDLDDSRLLSWMNHVGQNPNLDLV